MKHKIYRIWILFVCTGVSVLVNCSKNEDPEPPFPETPTVITKEVNVGSTYALSGGEVVDEGSDMIVNQGVIWSTSPNPTIDLSSKTSGTSGLGEFTANVAPLKIFTKYYLRAYATNSVGTAYGNEISFTTGSNGPCLISKYTNLFAYNTIHTYEFQYDDDKKLIGMSPQLTKFRYSGDSVYVNSVGFGDPLLMTSASSNGKVQSIKKYFSTGTYRYSFDYSINEQITIVLDYLSKTFPAAVHQNLFKGIYKFDAVGNVTEFQYYGYSDGLWVLYSTSTFIYDQSENPGRGLILPFFDWQTVPKVEYFSISNVLTETNVSASSTVETTFTIGYLSNGLPHFAIRNGLNSNVKSFLYVNCPF